MTHDEEIAALIPLLRDSDSLSLMQAVSLCQQAARVLERAQRGARDAALEEAARVVDGWHRKALQRVDVIDKAGGNSMLSEECASTSGSIAVYIRALKEKSP